MPHNPKGHFPKKGERLVGGVWMSDQEEEITPSPAKSRPPMNAAERRDWLRRQAGWPVLRHTKNTGGNN